MSWNLISLGEITNIRTGKLDANASSANGEYPFFTCAREPLKISSFSYNCECVLVAGNGDLNVKYYNGKFDAYQRTYIIESKSKEVLDVRYLFHFLDKYLVKLREQSIGGIIKYIKLGNLTEAKIPLPPLEEQRRIASILDQADELRQKRQQAIEKLDQLLQATFIDMFGDPVSNPKGFKTIEFSKIGKWKSGATPSKANENFWIGKFPWVSPKDMKTDHIFDAQDHISEIVFKETNLKKIDKGHLLIVVRGMILAHSFPTAINEVPISINQDMKAIEPIDDINVVYLKSTIDAFKPFILELISDAAHGTKRFDLIYAEVMKIPVPPMELQLSFQVNYENIKSQIENLKKQLSYFNVLFKSLQNQAFNGTL